MHELAVGIKNHPDVWDVVSDSNNFYKITSSASCKDGTYLHCWQYFILLFPMPVL